MEEWVEDERSTPLGTYMDTQDMMLQSSINNFERYLSAQPEDLDLSQIDNGALEKILLLPNGRKISIANESMLTGSIDF